MGLLALTLPRFGTGDEPEARHYLFSVKHSVEMTSFIGGPSYSADGRSFAFVTQRGNVQTGRSEANLWIGSVEGVKATLESRKAARSSTLHVVASLAATINGGSGDLGLVISRTFWGSDSQSVYFLGRDGQEDRRLFVARIAGGSAQPLTPSGVDIVDCTEDAGTLLCLAGPSIEPGRAYAADHPADPDHVVGVGQSLDDLLFPNSRLAQRFSPTPFGLWALDGNKAHPIANRVSGEPLRLIGSYYDGALALSPDHRFGIVLAHAPAIPAAWESYAVPGDLDGVRFHADPPAALESGAALMKARRDYTRARQYLLVDIDRGTAEPLIDAPVADFMRGLEGGYRVRWSGDGKRVAVSATYLPIVDQQTGAHRLRPCVVAVIDLSARTTKCLAETEGALVPAVSDLQWRQQNTHLSATWADQHVTFSVRSGGRSKSRPAARTSNTTPELAVRQDLNHPPVLAARNPKGGAWQTLLDPNPQLAAINLGEALRYTWKAPNGATAAGVLAKPPGFVPGRRYPLVIQTHGYSDSEFFRTGTSSETANAGRALAARGIIVLQIWEPHTAADGTWRESTERGMRLYLTAIDRLSSEGLVDPSRVGITGYSRRAAYVLKSIEEAPERFTAAAVSNTEPGSLFGYFTFVDGRSPDDVHTLSEFMAGARPYGDGLQQWADRAPGLRTDRIRAPLMITAGDPPELLVLWNLYAPLRDQGKPVELQYFRGGQHNLTKPLQVFAHQEMLVDWFDFWLNGHEDPDPAKKNQYERWRALRESAAADTSR